MDYYFISDLHIGGDGPLDVCEFEEELIAFLQELEQASTPIELIINGDAFGLWEFTELKGVDKIESLARTHKPLFDQFKKTGEKVKITLIPGNHDYDLACDPAFIPALKKFNIDLEPVVAVTREVAGKKIWIEHGMQHDEFNRFEHFGDSVDTPIGFFVTNQFVSGAGELSKHGKQNWLKDIQAVYPTEYIPHWVFSNYFYNEMSPLLRYLLVPFLVTFTLSVGIALFGIAEHMGLLSTQIGQLHFLSYFGGLGKLLLGIITVNVSIATFLLMLAIPLYFVFRDIRQTLERYHLIGHEGLELDKEENYLDAAQKVFDEDPNVCAFIYGHTHRASLTMKNGKAVINTGTWLKTLSRVSTLFYFLPDVYLPDYRLNYFKIREDAGDVLITYHLVPKKSDMKLSLLQKIMTFRNRNTVPSPIPSETRLLHD